MVSYHFFLLVCEYINSILLQVIKLQAVLLGLIIDDDFGSQWKSEVDGVVGLGREFVDRSVASKTYHVDKLKSGGEK